MSALSLVIGYIMYSPFVGLILLAVLLTLLVLTLEPATGKAMAQVVVPITIILFVFQVVLNPAIVFDPWMLLIVGAVLYMMFALFTGGGGLMEGGFVDAKIAIKLFPLFGLAIFISVLMDQTGRTTVYIMVGTIFCLMLLYVAFLRNYEDWPEYEYGKMERITAITDIDPKGKVKAGAEIWWAKTDGPPIEKGESVKAVAMSGLTMIVAREDESVQAQNQ
jgi:membrane-bound ClpP family serine protease